jgi:hypothetical protein
MKHATPTTIKKLAAVLADIRALPLKEKSPGCFYSKGKGFLHFHEHGDLIFADVTEPEVDKRYKFNTDAERKRLVAKVKKLLS